MKLISEIGFKICLSLRLCSLRNITKLTWWVSLPIFLIGWEQIESTIKWSCWRKLSQACSAGPCLISMKWLNNSYLLYLEDLLWGWSLCLKLANSRRGTRLPAHFLSYFGKRPMKSLYLWRLNWLQTLPNDLLCAASYRYVRDELSLQALWSHPFHLFVVHREPSAS